MLGLVAVFGFLPFVAVLRTEASSRSMVAALADRGIRHDRTAAEEQSNGVLARTPGHGYELVQDPGLLLLGCPLLAQTQRFEEFVFRLLADVVVHRVPPEVGNIPLRPRYDFGNKINESTRVGKDNCNRLSEFAGAVAAFFEDLKAAKLAERITLLAFSEFGRTIKENGSEGTDHGTAGVVFLAGPGVRGGVAGSMPSLSDLVAGEPKMTTDFRQVYTAVLEDWLGLVAGEVLGRIIRAAKRFQELNPAASGSASSGTRQNAIIAPRFVLPCA